MLSVAFQDTQILVRLIDLCIVYCRISGCPLDRLPGLTIGVSCTEAATKVASDPDKLVDVVPKDVSLKLSRVGNLWDKVGKRGCSPYETAARG